MTTMEQGVFTSYLIHIVLLSMSFNYLCLSEQDRCDYYGCKKPNDQNDCDSDVLCECQEGLVRPNPQMLMCLGKCSICFKWFTSFPFPSAFSQSTHFPAQASMCISESEGCEFWLLSYGPGGSLG